MKFALLNLWAIISFKLYPTDYTQLCSNCIWKCDQYVLRFVGFCFEAKYRIKMSFMCDLFIPWQQIVSFFVWKPKLLKPSHIYTQWVWQNITQYASKRLTCFIHGILEGGGLLSNWATFNWVRASLCKSWHSFSSSNCSK